MEKIKAFIKKYKAEIIIVLCAISSFVADISSVKGVSVVACGIIIAVIAAVLEVIKNGITDTSIKLIAKAVELIIEAMNKQKETDVKAVSADAPITAEFIEEQLREAL